MATYKWAVKSTGRPFGPAEKLEASDYTLLSRHTTFDAARKRMEREQADMHRHCGQGAWDNHFHVFPLVPIHMHGTRYCYECDENHSIGYTWQPEEFDPFDKLQWGLCPRSRHEEVANA